MYVSPAWFSADLALFAVSALCAVFAWHYARVAALYRPPARPEPGPRAAAAALPAPALPELPAAAQLGTLERLYTEIPHCVECGQLGEPGEDLVGNSFGETGRPLTINWYCKDVRTCSDRKLGRMLADTATLPALCPCGSGRPREMCPGSWHFPPPPASVAIVAEPHQCDPRDPCSPEDGWICSAGRPAYYPRRDSARPGKVTR